MSNVYSTSNSTYSCLRLSDHTSTTRFQLTEKLFNILAVNMADKYDEYDYEEVQGRAGRKGRSKAEVSLGSLFFTDVI